MEKHEHGPSTVNVDALLTSAAACHSKIIFC
jgi:hypothetical protein